MNTRRFAMNYGAVLGLCLVAIASVMWSFGVDEFQSKMPFYLNTMIIIIMLVYSIVNFRDTENDGFISYGESLKLGTSVAFFSTLITSFYGIIFLYFINTEYIPRALDIVEQILLKQDPNISDEDLDMGMRFVSKLYKPHWLMLWGIIKGTFGGFFLSLIISFFTKKEDPNVII